MIEVVRIGLLVKLQGKSWKIVNIVYDDESDHTVELMAVGHMVNTIRYFVPMELVYHALTRAEAGK